MMLSKSEMIRLGDNLVGKEKLFRAELSINNELHQLITPDNDGIME